MHGKLVSAVPSLLVAAMVPLSMVALPASFAVAQEQEQEQEQEQVQVQVQDIQDASMASMEEGKRLYRRGDYRAAIDALSAVVTENPERAEAHYLIGYAHLMLREFAPSVEAFSRAFVANPSLDPRTIYGRPAPAE
jgi:tetratricopeptide (TPR) repeat protein